VSNIHPAAVIEEGAKIGKGVEIAPFVFISKNAVIGDNTKISQGACIYNNTTIGKNCEIGAYTVLGSLPQSIGHDKNQRVELIIGDNNQIKEYVLISMGTSFAEKKTVIGDNNYIMAYVHIGHDSIVGDGNIMANATNIGGHVRIGNKNVFGAMTGIHQFVQIGSYCMIGGASAITQDIPSYTLAEGNRAKVRGLNIIGIRRNFGREVVDGLKKSYRELFRSGNPIKETADTMLKGDVDEFTKEMCEFIIDSKRGIPFDRTKEEEDEDAK